MRAVAIEILEGELVVVLGDGGAIGPESDSAELGILLPEIGFEQFGRGNEAQDGNVSSVETAVSTSARRPGSLTIRRQVLRLLPEGRPS